MMVQCPQMPEAMYVMVQCFIGAGKIKAENKIEGSFPGMSDELNSLINQLIEVTPGTKRFWAGFMNLAHKIKTYSAGAEYKTT